MTTSDNEGCACVVKPSSKDEPFINCNNEISFINSVTCGPIILRPMISSSSLLTTISQNPFDWVTSSIIAFPIALKGTLILFALMPAFFACSKFLPIEAISGFV